MSSNHFRRGWWKVAVVLVALAAAHANAAQRGIGVARLKKANPDDRTVELFSAVESGEVEVRLIPRNEKHCRVFLENKTDRPLNVQFPQAFAGAPVAPQMLPGFGQNQPTSAQPPQQIGGAFPAPAGNNRRGDPGANLPWFNLLEGNGPLFNVAPEHVGELKLTTVCLEYGKPTPRPKIPYALRPIEKATDKPAVWELCRLMGRGDVDQRAAQAAAWHLNGGKTWKELKTMKTGALLPVEPRFTAAELRAAKKLVEEAKQLAEARKRGASAAHQPRGANSQAVPIPPRDL